MTANPPSVASALVIAHPAHELRVLGWMGRARPLVSVLTTGSRAGCDRERLAHTGELVTACGARRGTLFGPVLDRDLYGAMIGGDVERFRFWIETLAGDFVRHRIELVVADGWQGYSPAHDLAHLMARLAAAQAARDLGRPVRVMEYAVAPDGLTPLQGDASPTLSLTLDAAETAAKARAVAAYPDIEAEAAEIDLHEGSAGLGVERFFVPAPLGALLRPQAGGAYYERIGEARVAQGLYRAVLRESHVASIARALMADTADVMAPRVQASLA